MEIPLINTYLRIKISRRPKIHKLKKELSDFFDKHEISGIKIKNFNLTPSTGDSIISFDYNKTHYNIVEIYPEINGMKLSMEDDHSEEIEKIGKKYRLSQLRFSLDCYGK